MDDLRQELRLTLDAVRVVMEDQLDPEKVSLRRVDVGEALRHEANQFNVAYHLDDVLRRLGSEHVAVSRA